MIVEINTIADLLENFIPKGVTEIEQAIKEEQISHPVTIGTMYEGLTKEALLRSTFAGLNLKIVTNCHIEGSPKEYDVLLIEGSARQLPFTDRFVVNPGQVIAVIQVKKNLYSADLSDSYDNLKMLFDYYDENNLEPFMYRLLRDGFKAICRKDIAQIEAKSLSDSEKAIHQALRADALLPVRIVWGFNGFASEHAFRESFFSYMEKQVTTDIKNYIGYMGPHNFPSLIICGNYTLLKLNGMPFGAPLGEEEIWTVNASSSQSYVKYLLELVWTRLSYRFKLPPDIFGEDLEVEQVTPFLSATYGTLGEKGGWNYRAYQPSKEKFKTPLETQEWQPAILDDEQFAVIQQIIQYGEIETDNDPELEEFVTMSGKYHSLQDFIEQIIATNLVFLDGHKLKLLVDQCDCITLPDGRNVAAENKSGRLSNWVAREMSRQATSEE